MKRIILLLSAMSLSACSTVSMPNLDFLKLPEFKDEAENISKSYPDVSEAPDALTDVRSDRAWDRSAKRMLRTRDKFYVPGGDVEPKTDAEIEREFKALEEKVQEYKLDDPS